MDNSYKWEHDVAYQEVPYEEALARLYELRDRYNASSAVAIAGSASERHKAAHGHRLTFGCCRDIAREVNDLEKEEAALLAAFSAGDYDALGRSRRSRQAAANSDQNPLE